MNDRSDESELMTGSEIVVRRADGIILTATVLNVIPPWNKSGRTHARVQFSDGSVTWVNDQLDEVTFLDGISELWQKTLADAVREYEKKYTTEGESDDATADEDEDSPT